MRLYSGCGTRRLTSTTMVLAILVDTTWPTFWFFNPCLTSVSAMLFLLSSHFPLPQDGVDPRPVLLHLPRLLEPFHLPHGHLKLKTESLLFHFTQLVAQFRVVETADFANLHDLLHILPAHEPGFDGQFVRRQPHRRSRGRTIHAF